MPARTLSDFRVLSVDDDEDACEMLSLLLKQVQIDVTCVHSAAEAWKKIKTERFGLYLLDAWLPDVDGFDLCRQIRVSDPTTPILFYSGAAYDVDKEKGMASGANAYVTKPNVDLLVTTMGDWIAKAGAKTVAPLWISTKSFPARSWSTGALFAVKAASN